MATYRLCYNQQLFFPGNWKPGALCHLRIYLPDHRAALTEDTASAIAVVTNLPQNTNTSTTNRIEHLALQVADEHPELQTRGFRLFEHWPGRRVPPDRRPDRLRWPIPDETFSEVSFPNRPGGGRELGAPQWRFMRREQLEGLIGMEYAEVPGCEELERETAQ